MAEVRTNPGDRSVSELEREVDRERERVSATIDELQQRASVGSLVDQIVKAVGENGGEVSRNLGRTLRDNPLPALLTGVGLVWLMASSGRPRHEWERWEEEEEEDDDRRYFPGEGDAIYGSGPGEGASSEYAGSAEGDGPGLGDRMAGTAGDMRERAAAVGGRVAGAVGALGEQASELTHAARSKLSGAGRRVRSVGRSASHRASGANREVQQGLEALLDEQPLVLGALAMAVGAAIGGALPRSRVEDRMFGAQSDRAIDTIRDLAGEQASKVQAMAGAVAEEGLNIASETAAELGSQLPSGDEIVDAAEQRLRDAATRLQEAGRGEAERQNPEPPRQTE